MPSSGLSVAEALICSVDALSIFACVALLVHLAREQPRMRKRLFLQQVAMLAAVDGAWASCDLLETALGLLGVRAERRTYRSLESLWVLCVQGALALDLHIAVSLGLLGCRCRGGTRILKALLYAVPLCMIVAETVSFSMDADWADNQNVFTAPVALTVFTVSMLIYLSVACKRNTSDAVRLRLRRRALIYALKFLLALGMLMLQQLCPRCSQGHHVIAVTTNLCFSSQGMLDVAAYYCQSRYFARDPKDDAVTSARRSESFFVQFNSEESVQVKSLP